MLYLERTIIHYLSTLSCTVCKLTEINVLITQQVLLQSQQRQQLTPTTRRRVPHRKLIALNAGDDVITGQSVARSAPHPHLSAVYYRQGSLRLYVLQGWWKLPALV